METSQIYCLVPADLAGRLHDLLRDHFRDHPSIEVIVEGRGRERRAGIERRVAPEGATAPTTERRRVRNTAGRRIGDRRAPVVELSVDEAPPLPRRARRDAARLAFVERVAPRSEAAEDADTARLVTRIQAGEQDLFSELYLRYFDRVYAYLRVVLRNQHDAEDATQQVFAQLFERIDQYERRRQPFRAWLFVAVRNTAVSQLRKQGRLEVTDPSEIDRQLERNGEGMAEIEALNWISDGDLRLFLERLPMQQRQAITLRFMLGLSVREIAAVLELSENHVRVLTHRGLRFLEKRLGALDRTPGRAPRSRSRRCARQAPVLRARRWVLVTPK